MNIEQQIYATIMQSASRIERPAALALNDRYGIFNTHELCTPKTYEKNGQAEMPRKYTKNRLMRYEV